MDDSIEDVKAKFGGVHNVEFFTAHHFGDDVCIPEVIRWEQTENGFKAYFKTTEISAASIIQEVLKIYKVEDIKINDPTILLSVRYNLLQASFLVFYRILC